MQNPLQIHQGGCLCGAVRYEAEGPPIVVAHCHCEACQRASGAGHSTVAMFPASAVHLTGNVSDFKYYADNGNEVTKCFCPLCGSSIIGRNTGTEDHVAISLGTLDDSTAFEPQVVVFASNRKPWDLMDQSLEIYQEQPNWKPKEDV